MEVQPELFLRKSLVDEYKEKAILAEIGDLEEMLQHHPATWWNAYSQKYGVKVREFVYEARNGFFISVERRVCTHRFVSRGISRRDKLLQEDVYTRIVPHVYRETWFDYNDAIRCYSILISEIEELKNPIPVELFGLWNSWGKVSKKDKFHHPRLIKPTWEKMKKNY